MASASSISSARTPRIDASLLTVDRSHQGLLHQTSAVTIRRAKLAGNGSTEVATLSYRTGFAKRGQLWDTTLRVLEHDVFGKPSLPNIVTVIAVAEQTDQRENADHHDEKSATDHPCLVVMEIMPTSLYDALHVDNLKLSRSDILFVATAVLDTLRALHQSGLSFGSILTSRKVMLGGTRHVKLRRFCSEWIRREADSKGIVSPSCLATSQYMMPICEGIHHSWTPLHHAQRSDLYAFGMLLLEMCAGVKPNPELYNSISLAGQVDLRLELIIRAALTVDTQGSVPANEPDELMRYCSRLLSECATADASQPTELDRCSSVSLKSFLHADRYFLELEERRVERQVAQRMSQSAVALKRLAAVEEDLVEEQRNFDVVVKQLEQLRVDKAHDEQHVKELENMLAQMRAEVHAKEEALLHSHAQLKEVHQAKDELAETLQRAELSLQQARAQRSAVENERQALSVEVLRLKDEKRESLDEKHELERQLAETAAKVGNEKDAIIELDARYSQAIHRCEQEKASRRAVERQLEALSRQLTAMEEERSRYCGALQIAPTGHLDARSSKNLVLELKEKEVLSLRTEKQALITTLVETQDKLETALRERNQFEDVVCPGMRHEIGNLQREMEQATHSLSELSAEREALQKRIDEMNTHTTELQSTIATLETQVCDLQKQIAEADKARRLRQCLTANCDAPRYLVKASGFCVDCEEKMSKERSKSRASVSSTSTASRGRGDRGHRRQHSLDTVSAILNNKKNLPIIDLLKRIEVARDIDDETREESALELVSILKQLGKLLKESVDLKEDLPECGVLRSILSLMEQFLSTPPLVIECCKTLSITIFNHDRNRLILVAEGAVEMLLKVLRAYPHEVKIQEIGAVLITNLSHNCESNRQRILAAGGVDAVLDMMQAFPRDAGIQKKSCWALLTLAGSDSMCDKIAALGGVGAVLAAMLNCPGDEDVQHYGCWALLNLVSGTTHLQEFARREGVAEVVEAALACFPDHHGIQEKCQDILELVHASEETSS